MPGEKFIVEIWGEQAVRYTRNLVVEVPEGTTGFEVEDLLPSAFAKITEPSMWKQAENTDVYLIDAYGTDVKGTAGADEPVHARLVRDADGELVLDQE